MANDDDHPALAGLRFGAQVPPSGTPEART
jgi:hypothetical protein